jgi:hypothetical protein
VSILAAEFTEAGRMDCVVLVGGRRTADLEVRLGWRRIKLKLIFRK